MIVQTEDLHEPGSKGHFTILRYLASGYTFFIPFFPWPCGSCPGDCCHSGHGGHGHQVPHCFGHSAPGRDPPRAEGDAGGAAAASAASQPYIDLWWF